MNNAQNHHFTVIIPTRERSDTLQHALHTCVIQDYDNLEILISDNFSQDHTREVVESYKDSRIRYINTGKRLSMTDNFEFALLHIQPKGYVIYIGDDDGFLPNAIRDINAVIVETGTQVLRWDPATYWWPMADSNRANQLFIYSLGSGTTVRKSAIMIQDVLSFREGPQFLPLMYTNSVIDYEVIRKIKIKDASGRLYHSRVPDAYIAFAIAGTVDSFVNSRRPYALVGISHHSSGQSTAGFSSTGPAIKFLAEDNLPYHSSLVFCLSHYQCFIESFLQARDYLPFLRKFTVDMEKLAFLMMNEAAPKAQDIYMSTKNAVLHLGKMYNISESVQRAIAANPKRELGYGRKPTIRNIGSAGLYLARLFIQDLCRSSLRLDCSYLNVKNIYDASLLCDHILRLKAMNVIGLSAVLKSSLVNIKRIVAPTEQNSMRQVSREIVGNRSVDDRR